MLTGLFLDLRNLEPWRRPWADHYRRTLEGVAIAEGLGLDAVWLTEHHFFDDGYLPQPLVLAATLAVRTTRVRIGTGIVIAPLRHPVHLVEEAALVDLLSNGRLELGLGAGWARQEFATFGADHAGRFRATDAALEEVRRLLSPGGVTPGPVQQAVPLWLGYQRPGGARRAVRLGAGLLSLDRTLLEPYLDGLAAGGHDPASARMGGLFDAVLADDPDAARELLRPHHAHQVATYRWARARAGGRGHAAWTTRADARRHGRRRPGRDGGTAGAARLRVGQRRRDARGPGRPARRAAVHAGAAGAGGCLTRLS